MCTTLAVVPKDLKITSQLNHINYLQKKHKIQNKMLSK